MPPYKAPGVYVEETSFRAKSIVGAPTSTTAFVGPTASGPLASDAEPEVLTSAQAFQQAYGGLDDLVFGEASVPNYLAHAARAYFQEGGKRLYVARVPGGARGAAPPSEAGYVAALDRLLTIEDISIVAAPGASVFAAPLAAQVNAALIAHAETAGAYRFAVLDAPPKVDMTDVREFRDAYDSKYAALYYPWVVVVDPLARPGSDRPSSIAMPPSGYVCGIYARNDVERAVWKAPANEVVRSALGLEAGINHAQQEVLNPLGINCIRFFEGRGFRVWGARTASSDPEWKYVNISRYQAYLEASLDRGLRWAAFEPNTEKLWANVRSTVSDFLYNEWQEGALLGDTPEKAFFVRCDRSTITQNDLDNGRLVCLVGVATIKPAEFSIFRIGQRTADAKS